MTFAPLNRHILCEKVSRDAGQDGFICERETAPEYRVLAVSDPGFFAKPGDIVVCATIGTVFKDGDREYVMFDEKSVAGVEL